MLRASVVFAVLSVSTVVQGAEFEVHPSLAASEEFTDNVFATSTNRISDYITHVQPGIAVSYESPLLTGNLGYVFDYRYYAKKNRDDEIAHFLGVKGHLTAVKNLLFLDVSDDFSRVSLDVTRDVTSESLFVNQADRNVATISPYLTLNPTERIMVRTGYRFIDTRYSGSSGIDKVDHVASLDLSYELSKRFSLTAGYTFIRELAEIDNYSQHNVLGGFRYEYADKSFVFAQAGNNWTDFDSGQNLNSIIWNAGLTHVFDTVTGTVATGVRYDEDPLRNIMKESFVSGVIEKRLNRGSLSLSSMYSEYVLTKTDTLQTRKYGATVRGQYEFTEDLKGSLGFTAEKYEQALLGSYTRRLQADSGLSYLLAEKLTVSLSYIYVDYYSPEIAADNRHVNRVTIALMKTF